MPERIDEYVSEDNRVRLIEVFVEDGSSEIRVCPG
jgi:hypothetical protein